MEKSRKEPRFIAHFDGYYKLNSDAEWHPCYIYDISDSGASIRLNQTLVIGDIIEISLDEDYKSHVIPATVANVVGQSVGIMFKDNDADEIIDLAVKKAFNNSRNKPAG